MDIEIQFNEHGVPQYPKGDARRLFVLLAAIEKLSRPTLIALANYTGHNKGTIDADVAKLCEQYGVKIERDGPVFQIVDWGDILKQSGVKNSLQVSLSNLIYSHHQPFGATPMSTKQDKLSSRDHQNMDAFLEHVLEDYKSGVITKEQAIGGLAHVIAAVDIRNYDEARRWFEQGRKFIRSE